MRSSIHTALALENLNEDDRQELISLLNSDRPAELRIQRARQLYHQAGVFEKANRLVDKHQAKAEEIADSVESDEFRRLLYYLIDTVLERSDDHQPTIEIAAPQPLTKALPILPKS